MEVGAETNPSPRKRAREKEDSLPSKPAYKEDAFGRRKAYRHRASVQSEPQHDKHTGEEVRHTIASGKEVGEDEIDWGKWWPFKRATGKALKQLNRRQRNYEYEDALL